MPALPRALRAVALPLVLAGLITAAAPGLIRVQRGDTLSEIAQRYSTSVAALKQLNHLSTDRILAGQALRIPRPPAPRPVTVEVRHRVRVGDTLIGIARKYGVAPATVAARNHLPPSRIVRLGDTLIVPVTRRGSQARVPTAPAASTPVPRQFAAVAGSVARHRAILAARPAPSRAYVRSVIRRTSQDLGVNPALALAIANQESGFQMRVVSYADAVGVMQVLPGTARWMSDVLGRRLDLLDVEDNILAGVALLRTLTRVASLDHAIAGYFQGLKSVRERGVMRATAAYVKNVKALMSRYR